LGPKGKDADTAKDQYGPIDRAIAAQNATYDYLNRFTGGWITISKTNITIVLLFVILVLWPGYTAKVKPLTIHVMDSLTNEPIEGAVVYYLLDTMRTETT